MSRLVRQATIRACLRRVLPVAGALSADVAPALGQCQLSKLVASDGGSLDVFAESVGVTGRQALVSARRHGHYYELSGGLYVYEPSEVGWIEVEEVTFPPGEGGGFGEPLSVDGRVAVAGAVGFWPRILERAATTWAPVQNLRPVGGFRPGFGDAIAIDAEGIVIGAPEDDNENGGGAGSAYVFERDPNGVWLQSARLLASDGSGGDAFGFSVAIHDDVIAVGAPEDDPLGFASGSAYVFERDPNGAWVETAKLLGDDGGGIDLFGHAVAVTGEAIAVAAPVAGVENAGRVYVFTREPDGAWERSETLASSDINTADDFGSALALDGAMMIAGARFKENAGMFTGAAYVFHRQPDGAWLEVGKLLASDGGHRAEFGRSVALSGNLAVVGAPFHDVVDSGGNTQVDAGAAYVFAIGPDRDENGVMDVCECRAAVDGGAPGPGVAGGFVASPDLDLDRRVGMGDLLILLTNFGHDRDNPPAGHSPPHAALHEYGDLDLDQDIDLEDLALMLAAYDRACE